MPDHPILPAGYNSWDNDGDDVNGSGVNEPIWPVLFDTFEAKTVLILTGDMLAAFEGCPDVIIDGEYSTVIFPAIDPVVPVSRDKWLEMFSIPAPDPVLVLQAASTVVQIPPDKWLETIVIPATRTDLVVPSGEKTHVITPQNNRIVPPANVDTDIPRTSP